MLWPLLCFVVWQVIGGVNGWSTGSNWIQTTTIRTNLYAEKQQQQRAGTSGYSILRQPLSWESQTIFDVPTTLDNNIPTATLPTIDEPLITTKTADELDLKQRTLDTLDYPLILQALKDECRTLPGKELVQQTSSNSATSRTTTTDEEEEEEWPFVSLRASSAMGATKRYQALKEYQQLIETNTDNIPALFYELNMTMVPWQRRAYTQQKNNVLTGDELQVVACILKSIQTMGLYLKKYCASTGELYQLAQCMLQVPSSLVDLLFQALEEDTVRNKKVWMLSGKAFPTLQLLREKRWLQQEQMRQLLRQWTTQNSNLVQLDTTDSSSTMYSQINGRIVVPMDPKNVVKGGRIQDVSRSGQTAYVEPPELIQPTNILLQIENEIKKEEEQIWKNLTLSILEYEDEIHTAIMGAAQMDLLQAKITLGQTRMKHSSTTIPTVKTDGILHVPKAKHPILLLKQYQKQQQQKYKSMTSTTKTASSSRNEVVGNTVDIGYSNPENCGLILTGPNSGGKTIILKLVGLLSLMARDGLLIPCDSSEGEVRIDFFDPILADIGDIQSVQGDLSTFSGHMLVCKQVLDSVASGKSNALVLMDELGSGTDPQQGVAIAQAILETLLQAKARVVITTHYMELKQLASSNSQLAVGGMQFLHGKPTYQLLPGVIGESYALAVAERLNLPSTILDRAKELMNAETRQMGELVQELQTQKEDLLKQQDLLLEQQGKVKKLQEQLEEQNIILERKILQVKRTEAQKYIKSLEEKEVQLKQILSELQNDPSKKIVAQSWESLRTVKRNVLQQVDDTWQQQLSQQSSQEQEELIPLSQLPPNQLSEIKEGDDIVICKSGNLYSKRGTLTSKAGKNQWQISFPNGMGMTMKLKDLSLPPSPKSPLGVSIRQEEKNPTNGPKLSKMARKALAMEQQEMEYNNNNNMNNKKKSDESDSDKSSDSMMRVPSNTIDVLGCNFEEAKRKCEDVFAKAMGRKNPVVYILHGHGAQGVLKRKIRDWLNRDRTWVQSYKSASAEDGGDAFTMVHIKKIKY